jgi:hypothetical protein
MRKAVHHLRRRRLRGRELCKKPFPRLRSSMKPSSLTSELEGPHQTLYINAASGEPEAAQTVLRARGGRLRQAALIDDHTGPHR